MSGHFAGRGQDRTAVRERVPYGTGRGPARARGNGQPKAGARRRSPSAISSGVCVVNDIRSVAGSGAAA